MVCKMIDLITPICPHCGEKGVIRLPEADYEKGLAAYQAGALMQEAFPNLSNEEREMLISGVDPKCWKEIFGSEEEV